MTTPADFRALCAELVEDLQYWVDRYEQKDPSMVDDTYSLLRINRARAVLAAHETRPPAAASPQLLRPVDRYTLSDAILTAWRKHGSDSWCSIADEVIAALATPEAVEDAKGLHGKYIIHRSVDGSPVEFPCFVLRIDGSDDAAMVAINAYATHPACPPELAADLVEHVKRNASFAVLGAAPEAVGVADEEIDDIFYANCTEDDNGNDYMDVEHFRFGAAAVLSRYGTAHPAPNHEAWNEFLQELQGLQNRAQAEGIGPRCDMVEWAQMLGTAHPAPVPVGERPWERELWLDHEGRCWFHSKIDPVDPSWHLDSPSEMGFQVANSCVDTYTHALPHWALPLPGDQP
jgi:hypothetical protein